MHNFKDYFFNKYMADAFSTCTPESDNIKYLRKGLKGEVGELYGALKKVYRESDCNSSLSQKIHDLIVGELGDVMWYIANIIRKTARVDIINSYYIPDTPISKYKTSSSGDLADYLESVTDRMQKAAIEYDEFPRINTHEILDGICIFCANIGVSITDIMKSNTQKLFKRKENGTLCGSGDYR